MTVDGFGRKRGAKFHIQKINKYSKKLYFLSYFKKILL